MGERIVYICDRCYREAEPNDKAVKWRRIYYGEDIKLLCISCNELLKRFFENQPTGATYLT